ncbi:MAG: biopolymer transporter ExbD [bacterium]
MALGNRRKNARGFDVPKLQITSMMDMFTIILIFLLTCYSDKPEVVHLEKDLRLPESVAQSDYQENIKLVLSRSNLWLEGEIVATVQDGEIVGLDPEKLNNSRLYQKLVAYRERADKGNLARPDKPGRPDKPDKPDKLDNQDKPEKKAQEHIIFLCDKNIPFHTINLVTKTAAMAGSPNFQFAVLKK